MQADPKDLHVIHNQDQHRFELQLEGHLAELTYRRQGDTIIFIHTGVPPAIEGRGIGSLLVKTGLRYASENRLKVKPLCWFVDLYIKRHPEFQQG
jgi:predicted GNAT family acetyltransferase